MSGMKLDRLKKYHMYMTGIRGKGVNWHNFWAILRLGSIYITIWGYRVEWFGNVNSVVVAWRHVLYFRNGIFVFTAFCRWCYKRCSRFMYFMNFFTHYLQCLNPYRNMENNLHKNANCSVTHLLLKLSTVSVFSKYNIFDTLNLWSA